MYMSCCFFASRIAIVLFCIHYVGPTSTVLLLAYTIVIASASSDYAIGPYVALCKSVITICYYFY